jgi:hypothetical protein
MISEAVVILQSPVSSPANKNFKKAIFVDAITLKVLSDLPFVRDQPLKSVEN